MIHPLRAGFTASTTALLITGMAVTMPAARADNDDNTLIPNNHRFNNAVVSNVYTIEHEAGCTNDVAITPALQAAAQAHTDDLMNNRSLDADIGSDGSSAQDRANAAGFQGNVQETVAINPALAMSGIELMHQWYYNPDDLKIMQDCNHTLMGVWSENSLDRTVVVAMYGQPAPGTHPPQIDPTDPNPDYDATGELEFGLDWLPWILRGVYPPPAYPAQ
jgi:uncharacterized protein YkwD